jgi:hypothetical protein
MPAKKKRALPDAFKANLFTKGGGRAADAKKPAAKKTAAKPKPKPKPKPTTKKAAKKPATKKKPAAKR